MDLNELSYRELQKAAAKLNIPANGKKEVLKKRVMEAQQFDPGKRKATESVPEEPSPKHAKINHNEIKNSTTARGETEIQKSPLAALEDTRSMDSSPNSFINMNEVSALCAQLIEVMHKSRDIAYQQQVFGKCLKQPLPLRNSRTFENYFSEDIIDTKWYYEFESFVFTIKSASDNTQTQLLGAVVKPSGYGKTHLARVYNRQNKSIYLNFADGTIFTRKIEAQIISLKPKYFNENSSSIERSFIDFTNMARQVVRVFLLAAVEHYMFFHATLSGKSNNLTEADVTAMCALLFDDEYSKLFLDRVDHYWKTLKGYSSVEELRQRVYEAVLPFKLLAVFCDNIHTLKSKFIGEFVHFISPPLIPWNNTLHVDRALYEQHVDRTPEAPLSEDFTERVRNAYKKPTSLSYLFMETFEEISAWLFIGFTQLTSDGEAIDFTSEMPIAARGRAGISEYRWFTRDSAEDVARYNKLIQTHFGIDLLEYLRTLSNYDRIHETLASQPIYCTKILHAILNFSALHKDKEDLQEEIGSIWSKVEELMSKEHQLIQ